MVLPPGAEQRPRPQHPVPSHHKVTSQLLSLYQVPCSYLPILLPCKEPLSPTAASQVPVIGH